MMEIMIIVPHIAFRNDSHHASYKHQGQAATYLSPTWRLWSKTLVCCHSSVTLKVMKDVKLVATYQESKDELCGFFHLLKEAGSTG